MINTLQDRSAYGISSSLQTQAAQREAVHAIRADNGQELAPDQLPQTPPDAAPGYSRRETAGQGNPLPPPPEISYESVASRVEKARQAAEEGSRDVGAVPAVAPNSGSGNEPMATEVEKHVRMARTAHRVVARYLMIYQDYSLSPAPVDSGGRVVDTRA